MTVIEGGACLPEVPACRTTVVISDPFVTMPEGRLWVQAVPDDGALGVTAVGAGSASERLPCSWREARRSRRTGKHLPSCSRRYSHQRRQDGCLCPRGAVSSAAAWVSETAPAWRLQKRGLGDRRRSAGVEIRALHKSPGDCIIAVSARQLAMQNPTSRESGGAKACSHSGSHRGKP